jgi:hypothetical protein
LTLIQPVITIQDVSFNEVLSELTCTVVIETFNERLQPKDMASVHMNMESREDIYEVKHTSAYSNNQHTTDHFPFFSGHG